MTKKEALTLMIGLVKELTDDIKKDIDKREAMYLKEFEKLAEQIKE